MRLSNKLINKLHKMYLRGVEKGEPKSGISQISREEDQFLLFLYDLDLVFDPTDASQSTLVEQ